MYVQIQRLTSRCISSLPSGSLSMKRALPRHTAWLSAITHLAQRHSARLCPLCLSCRPICCQAVCPSQPGIQKARTCHSGHIQGAAYNHVTDFQSGAEGTTDEPPPLHVRGTTPTIECNKLHVLGHDCMPLLCVYRERSQLMEWFAQTLTCPLTCIPTVPARSVP